MKIYLLDYSNAMVHFWLKYFRYTNVEVICDSLENFVCENDVECFVSPANSYGLMDGGYDAALTKVFGPSLEREVQDYIIKNLHREQPVGSSIIVNIPNTNKKLIHTPTMRIPSPIVDTDIIYQAMRSTLICALDNKIESIVIPAFGASTGMVDKDTVAYQMYRAYLQIFEDKTLVYSWSDLDKLDDFMSSKLKELKPIYTKTRILVKDTKYITKRYISYLRKNLNCDISLNEEFPDIIISDTPINADIYQIIINPNLKEIPTGKIYSYSNMESEGNNFKLYQEDRFTFIDLKYSLLSLLDKIDKKLNFKD